METRPSTTPREVPRKALPELRGANIALRKPSDEVHVSAHRLPAASWPPSDEGGAGYEQYVSDPAHPVPFLREKDTGMKPDYMALDQRFGAKRPDVLVYQSEPLSEDLTIAGSIKPNLFVSTTGTDGDWIVKVIDVYPEQRGRRSGGRRGGRVRGARARRCDAGQVQEQLLASGAVGAGENDASDVRHGRRAAHVQEGAPGHDPGAEQLVPLVDRNPQTFVDIYHAKPSDFRKATQRVYRSGAQASGIELQVLPPGGVQPVVP